MIVSMDRNILDIVVQLQAILYNCLESEDTELFYAIERLIVWAKEGRFDE